MVFIKSAVFTRFYFDPEPNPDPKLYILQENFSNLMEHSYYTLGFAQAFFLMTAFNMG